MFYFQLYAALFILMTTMLAFNVSRIRLRERVSLGDGESKALRNANRAHLNCLEHGLPFGLLVPGLAHASANTTLLGGLIFSFLTMRCLHAYGMLAPNFMCRRIGASASYLLSLTSGVLLLILTVWY